MKQTVEQAAPYQEAELRTLGPELGLFVITGSFDAVKQQSDIISDKYGTRNIQPSSFDRILSGKKVRRLGLFGL